MFTSSYILKKFRSAFLFLSLSAVVRPGALIVLLMERSKNFKSSFRGGIRVQQADLYLGECPIAEAGAPRLP